MSAMIVFGWAIILISLGAVGQTLERKIARLETLIQEQQRLLENLSPVGE
jgi:hypothetical protein